MSVVFECWPAAVDCEADAMQIMGGVRRGHSLAFGDVSSDVSSAVKILQSSIANKSSLLTPDQLQRANASLPSRFPLLLNGGNVNFRNAYQEENDNQIPVMEAMVFNPGVELVVLAQPQVRSLA